MAYISTIERFGIEKGIQLGIQKGIQQGIQKGIDLGLEQGRQKGGCQLLLHLLAHKFSTVPEAYQQKMISADTESLSLWAERLLNAERLEEVFEE